MQVTEAPEYPELPYHKLFSMRQILPQADAQQSCEIAIPGVASTGQQGQKWTFPNIQNLLPNMAFIMGLEVFFKDACPYGPVTGTAVASATIMESAAVWLYGSIPNSYSPKFDWETRKMGAGVLVQGNYLLQGVPLAKLNNIQTLASAATSPFLHEPMQFPFWLVDWTKSFIQLGAAPGNTTDVVVPFNISYCFRDGYLTQQNG